MQSNQSASNLVNFGMPTEPLFVGSYSRIPVQIDPSSGLTMEKLEFLVNPGPEAGIVSTSPERFAPPLQPMILLAASHKPGRHHTLLARDLSSGRIVGKGEFEVTSTWQDQTNGPSFWFSGAPSGMVVRAYAWGGGPSGPQNIDIAPAVGTRKIAVIFIDSPTALFDPAEIAGVIDKWRKEMVDGVPDAENQLRSVAHFFREVSHFGVGPSGLNFEADFFGPVTMPATWDTYYDSQGYSYGSTFQSMITQADPLIDFSQYKHVIVATKSTPNWPHADWGFRTVTTAEGNVTLGVVSMPYDWGADGGRTIHETAAHEIGHNLGLGDLYTAGPSERQMGNWELMHTEIGFPHVSVFHRMILGWIPANWIQTFNFAEIAAPVNQTVELHPAEFANPPGNRKTAVEVRIADGWNYYFEYRKTEPSQIGDQSLPENNRVLGTDAASYSVYGSFQPPRPPIMLLPPANGDGPVLKTGEAYHEVDVSTPTWPSDFNAEILTINVDSANLQITYDINSKPDPSIRPWPAGPNREWQSPDIEVRNARNRQDPNWFNVPHAGNPNTVVARVTNRGAINAPGVRVAFSIFDFTLGSATPEISLGSDTRDVSANASVDFFAPTQWIVADETHHYCVKARIAPYQVPGTDVREMTTDNNQAQSNYWAFISRTGSPSSRESTEVRVNNPSPHPAVVEIMPAQTNPLYRTYLQHHWVRLDAGEERAIQVMFEYAGEDFLKSGGSGNVFEAFRHVPNHARFRAVIRELNPQHPGAAPAVLGGAEVRVSEGEATLFDSFTVRDLAAEGIRISGRVVTKGTRKPAPDGTIILSFRQDKKAVNETAALVKGKFATTFKQRKWTTAQGYYLPPPCYADCYSKVYERKRQFDT
jgi:M6 family metalloprotease-like protein